MTNRFASWFMVAVMATAGFAVAEPKVDEKAAEVLREMSRTIQSADMFSVQASTSMKITKGDEKQDVDALSAIAIARPNRLRLELKAGDAALIVVSDGEKMSTYFPELNKYLVDDAPARLGDTGDAKNLLKDALSSAVAGTDILSILLSDDPYAAMIDDVESIEYIGEEEIDGVTAHRVRFNQDDLDFDIWISVEAPVVLLRLEPDFTRTQEEMAKRMPGHPVPEFKVVAKLHDWKLADIEPDRFVFVVPDGAEKVDSMADLSAADGESSLEGEEAPDFSLPLLNGGEMKLAAHRGKDVVILDFWATWCGPCVRAMPVLAGLAADYKDRGVVLYAVNQREKKEVIRKFLEAKKIEATVVLDSKGEVGALYGVTGIPQTVIIGKDGKVADVHVGFSPDLRKELAASLDSLLD